jgi:hypothetical protein
MQELLKEINELTTKIGGGAKFVIVSIGNTPYKIIKVLETLISNLKYKK